MDLRRGMLRIWIAATIVWLIVWGFRLFVLLACRPGGDHFVCLDFWYGTVSEPALPYWIEALCAVAPPLLLLVIGRVLLWLVERSWGGPQARIDRPEALERWDGQHDGPGAR